MSLTPNELEEYWFRQALAAAHIERGDWHPTRGADENRRIIPAVYDYYGHLFLENPFLEWAGMANLIGPALYAGMRDFGFFPDLMRIAVATIFGRRSRSLARRAAGRLGWFESTFLRMQKKVFEDQAPMQQAYLIGGISQIDEFHQARIIDVATRDAWRQIDAGRRQGDMALIGIGNRTLLFREQLDILSRFYIQMLRYHWPVGQLITYAMTFVGTPSIPGADTFATRYPFVLKLPGTTVCMQTPFPDGNIAVFVDRWKLIERDTLPRYMSLIRDSPELAHHLISEPVAKRVRSYLLPAQAARLGITTLTNWRLDVDLARLSPGSSTRELRQFDLTRPPTRDSVGIPEGVGSKVWMDPKGKPFEVGISLPGGRTYHAWAEVAAMLSGSRGDEPDRLIVQLPPTGIDFCKELLTALAAEWDFPTEAAVAWHSDAKRRESSDRSYSTHVFTCSNVGLVYLEFQVVHHVQDRYAVVTALFSWQPQESH